MMFFLENFPWIGLIVALSFSGYAVLRKIISVETDIGLFVESLFLIPIIILIFYNLSITDKVIFSFSNINLSLYTDTCWTNDCDSFIFICQRFRIIKSWSRKHDFFIAPTGQFLLGLFLYNEPFLINKLIGFVLIWIAVLIYLRDLYEKN